MSTPSNAEQYLLELINRARSDPAGELDHFIVDRPTRTAATPAITQALAFFDVDMDMLHGWFDDTLPAPPLAWDSALADSAATHSMLMIEFDQQSHLLPGEPGLGERIAQAGYTGYSAAAENIFAFGQDPLYTHAAFYIDWGEGPGGIQSPPGHREVILSETYTDVGIAQIAVTDPDLAVGPFAVTQHFGNQPGDPAKLTGVVIDDVDGDAFYDMGEGLGSVMVTATGSAGRFSAITWESGGYTLELPEGSYAVAFSGGSLEGTITASANIADRNVKLDAFAADALPPEPDDPHTARYAVARAEAEVLLASEDIVRVTLPDGSVDVLTDIQRLSFADGDLLFDLSGQHLGQAYRLYGAAFGRTPDEDGLRFWNSILGAEAPRDEVAEAFVESAEFARLHGEAPADEAYVDALYLNTLKRPADPEGLAFWTVRLESDIVNEAELLVAFAESPENVARVAPDLDDGVWVL